MLRFRKFPIPLTIRHQSIMTSPTLKFENSALFICDIQEKFRKAINEYDKVILTTQKMLRAAQIFNIPVIATTQLRGKLGPTDPDLKLDPYNPKIHADKSRFSMWTPEVQATINETYGQEKKIDVVIVGIESHICVTQTTLDLLKEGHRVFVLADGVSSCNPQEVPIALARLRAEGAKVTTSESWIYECMADASLPQFKAIAGLVKDTKQDTQKILEALCKI